MKLISRGRKGHPLKKRNGAVRIADSVMSAKQDAPLVEPSSVNREDSHA